MASTRARHLQVRAWRVTLHGALSLLLAGCATVYKPQNQRIENVNNQRGYRLIKTRHGDYQDHLVFLTFSGGGTRAAALAYGVLQELRDTPIISRGQHVRLLDEVDSISSVSGGSFTAAYYGLFGDEIFSNFEKTFLRQSIQGALITKLFSPSYWWRALFTRFDRTEMAIEFYDQEIFKGKKFSDIRLADGPYIEINATEIGSGNRFAFTQAQFDAICSKLEDLSVARAVTASSAVPIAFPTVVIKNYAGECDIHQTKLLSYLSKRVALSPRLKELKERITSYADQKKLPYLHLVDGGISDNLGLRAIVDRIESIGSGLVFGDQTHIPTDVLVIAVNAEVKPERGINRSADKPTIVDTIDAFSSVQMDLYNKETELLLTQELNLLQEKLRERGHDVRVHAAEISFESIQAKSLKSYFNNLPTSLELSDKDVDMLISIGRKLLREQPGYREFLQLNEGVSSAVEARQRPAAPSDG